MERMPVVFIGHGSPMNAIEDNMNTKQWKSIAKSFEKPKAIVVISAHWYVEKTMIQDNEQPKMIYDMYGFPEELYEIIYPAKGNPELARDVDKHISKQHSLSSSWGYDHGAWSVLVHMYPEADIPVFQISIDAYASPEDHYKIGQELAYLREHGVLILGSGNVVHNLRMLDWQQPTLAFDWAKEFDSYIEDAIKHRDIEKVLQYDKHPQANKAVPTPDHFFPLLYCLGASDENDKVEVYCKTYEMGSLSMSSYVFR